MRYLLTNPTSDVFGCRIKGQYFIQVFMIQPVFYQLLDMAEIRHHTVFVQLLRPALTRYNPVMAMQIGALTRIRKAQVMCRRYFQSFNYGVHRFYFGCKDTRIYGFLIQFHREYFPAFPLYIPNILFTLLPFPDGDDYCLT